jgi:hypothetical protein
MLNRVWEDIIRRGCPKTKTDTWSFSLSAGPLKLVFVTRCCIASIQRSKQYGPKRSAVE